jgi:hypothetical protein
MRGEVRSAWTKLDPFSLKSLSPLFGHRLFGSASCREIDNIRTIGRPWNTENPSASAPLAPWRYQCARGISVVARRRRFASEAENSRQQLKDFRLAM